MYRDPERRQFAGPDQFGYFGYRNGAYAAQTVALDGEALYNANAC